MSTGRSKRKVSRVKTLKRNTTIDGLTVNEPFTFSIPRDDKNEKDPKNINGDEGEGCYISGVIGHRKYYGILIEQSTLTAATDMFFKNEASSLEMNRRMMTLKEQQMTNKKQGNHNGEFCTASGRVNEIDVKERSVKKARLAEEIGRNNTAVLQSSVEVAEDNNKSNQVKKQVQKFRYVDSWSVGESGGPGYRDLLATFADVNTASEDNAEKAFCIEEACKMGGNFVNDYYYQYELTEPTLQVNNMPSETDRSNEKYDIWSSLGFHTFLKYTPFPQWFPLSNKSGQQKKVLQMLQMEQKNAGVAWNTESSSSYAINSNLSGTSNATTVAAKTLLPMQPRNHFRIGVLGGGIAGLASAYDLLRLADSKNIDVQVVLLEARSRVGGRLQTDYKTFKSANGQPFPVDLGGAWIHGIDKNPLANLATEAGIEFMPTSDDVKMLEGNMGEVDKNIDKRVEKLFNDILDAAAEDCWAEKDDAKSNKVQSAIRWYASILNINVSNSTSIADNNNIDLEIDLEPTDVLEHRYSSDIPIDSALSQVVHQRSNLCDQLSGVEKNLLLWCMKNLEYAMAGNISDLSMKYWDASELHEFKGDHVLLKQGYSAITNYLFQKCQKYPNFEYELNHVVKKIEYARKTTNIPYLKQHHKKRTIALSDTCCVTSKNNEVKTFDFLISSLPLGVLKNRFKQERMMSSSNKEIDPEEESKITFEPTLPFWKSDSIDSTGFGLLNKVILQFPAAFWRIGDEKEFLHGSPYLGKEQFSIGNASGKNSEHYIFYDLGKCLSKNLNTAPPILMTLISGLDAVISEQLSEEKLVECVMETLKHLYSNVEVPDPLVAKRTLWGSDPYSKGSYTFLPPGSTNEDYQMLQYPINENSDTHVVDEMDTMRLFWAGEHTSSSHPSTAHGAFFSGIRAAKEVIDSLFVKEKIDNRIERQIPLLFYRLKHPKASLDCHLCQHSDSRSTEGPLLAFERASQRILIHLNCAKFTSDVMVVDGAWRNIFKALNRAKQLSCSLCGKLGASIGCASKDCDRSYHYHCCLETGWTFRDTDRKFFCDSHRSEVNLNNEIQESNISASKNGGIQHNLFNATSSKTTKATLSKTTKAALSKTTKATLSKTTNATLSKTTNATSLETTNVSSSKLTNPTSSESKAGPTNESEKKDSTSAQKQQGNKSSVTKTFTLDPHITNPEIGRLYNEFKSLHSTRRALTDVWGICLTVSEICSTNTVTLRIPSSSGSKPLPSPPHGLLPGDIILEVNGIKLGSHDLMNANQVQSLMKRVTELHLLIIRKSDSQHSSLV